MGYAISQSRHKYHIEPYMASIIVAILVVPILFFLVKIPSYMLSSFSLSVLASNGGAQVGQSTQGLLTQITETGLSPVVIDNIKRATFSVEGKMVTLDGDNIQVFEYPDNIAALSDAQKFASSSETKYGAWKKDAHLYTRDNLIVFYLGNRVHIINTLDSIWEKTR